jgi:hypothetical protein
MAGNIEHLEIAERVLAVHQERDGFADVRKISPGKASPAATEISSQSCRTRSA